MRKPGYNLALAGLLLCFIVVILGAYTRLVHAGLGCPDWPGCYGFLTVPQSDHALETAQLRFPDDPVEAFKAWAEMIHRYAAGTLGLLILGLAVIGIRQRRDPGYPTGLCVGLLALVVCQALFGMWTVTLKLWPQVVTAHLLGGFATLSLLLLLVLRLSGRLPALHPTRSLTRLRLLARFALAVVILQIMLGGWTSTNYAAVACIDLPTCHGEWWPEMDFHTGFNLLHQEIGPNYLGGMLEGPGRTAIHFTHRLGALLTTFVVLLLGWQLWRARLHGLALLLCLALTAQVGLGITNVLAALPLAVAVAHNGMAALLLLCTLAVNYRVRAPATVRVRLDARPRRSLASHA
ncbi:heme A synthase [Halopseudomonas aestusnigri]|jgi:cytochrome c oxidase assembly protein subunit 15|uniref:COX15/CtaA family protein n=1 Tax=Halopseudomonas TaxID=2901189 RepID=UPI0022B5E8AD|nr:MULTISPECIES: COX15/CtaA family protein [Halopseudomonas]BDX18037.1 heme A synthase [Halopseudomonas aestusnigri]